MIKLCVSLPQLYLPTELYAAGPMGHRVRDGGRQHPADHSPQQAPLPGPYWRLQGRIVSICLWRTAAMRGSHGYRAATLRSPLSLSAQASPLQPQLLPSSSPYGLYWRFMFIGILQFSVWHNRVQSAGRPVDQAGRIMLLVTVAPLLSWADWRWVAVH